MHSYKKLAVILSVFIPSIFFSSVYADYSIKVVNLYPGNLSIGGGSGQGDQIPQDIFVWGIPQNAKPLMLARIPFGSEAALSWPTNLNTLYFFNTRQAKRFEYFVSQGRSDALQASLYDMGGKDYHMFQFNKTNAPASGSRVFVIPKAGDLQYTPVTVVTNLQAVTQNLIALANMPPQISFPLKPEGTYLGARPWTDRMMSYATGLTAKFKLLGITDAAAISAVNALYKKYADLAAQLPAPTAPPTYQEMAAAYAKAYAGVR